MPSDRTYNGTELAGLVGVTAASIKDMQDAGLISPCATTADGLALYDQEALENARAVGALLALGYDLTDIKKIEKKVGIPTKGKARIKRRGKGKLLTVGELAKRADLNPRTIKYWEEQGILSPEVLSEGGFRYYSEQYVLFCNLIRDLQIFGYSLKEIRETADLFRKYYDISLDVEHYASLDTVESLEEMLARIRTLRSRMNMLKEGIKRWEGFTDKYRRRIERLKGRVARILAKRESVPGGDPLEGKERV